MHTHVPKLIMSLCHVTGDCLGYFIADEVDQFISLIQISYYRKITLTGKSTLLLKIFAGNLH